MERWEINKVLDTLSPEEQKTFAESIIKQEKKDIWKNRGSMAFRSIVAALGVCGIAAAVGAEVFGQDSSLINTIQTSGILTSLGSLGAFFAADTFTSLLDDSVDNMKRENRESKANIQYLKEYVNQLSM